MPRPIVDRRPKRLGYGTLSLITSGIGRDKHVRLVPGEAWDIGSDGRTVTYPREKLADINESLALRSIYSNVGHVLYSQEPSPWKAIAKILRRVERSAITKDVQGQPVQIGTYVPYGIIRVLERERVERVQRREYAGLAKVGGTTARPYLYERNLRGKQDLFERLQMELDSRLAGAPGGTFMPAEVLDGLDIDAYANASTFAGALAIAPKLVADIVLRFLAQVANEETPQQREPEDQQQDTNPSDSQADDEQSNSQESEPQDDDDASEGESQGDGDDDADESEGDEDSESDGQSEAEESGESDNDDNEADSNPTDDADESDGESDGSESDDDATDESDPSGAEDDASDDGSQNDGQETDQNKDGSAAGDGPTDENGTPDDRPTLHIPPYLVNTVSNDVREDESFLDTADVTAAQVSNVGASRETFGENFEDLTDEALSGVLRAAFDAAIKPNRRWAIQENLDRGSLQIRAAVNAIRKYGNLRPGRDHIHGKRLKEDKKRVRIAFLTDNSYSMRTPIDNHPNVKRIELAARFVVSAIAAVEHLPEVEVGVWTFDTSVNEIAMFGKHADKETRRHIGKQMVTTGGGGTDAPLAIAALRAINALPTKPNTQTFLFLLTDGEWGSPGSAQLVTQELQGLLAEEVDLAVFTIGCAAEEAKSFVGHERADEMTDETAEDMVCQHIERLLDPVS
jgi:hypothetical protein